MIAIAILGGGLEAREVKIPAIGILPGALSLGFGSFLVLLALKSPEMIEGGSRVADRAGSPKAGWGGGRADSDTGAWAITITDMLAPNQSASRLEVWFGHDLATVSELDPGLRPQGANIFVDDRLQAYRLEGRYRVGGGPGAVTIQMAGPAFSTRCRASPT
ncbi:hypothetical protein ACFQS7_19740 [Dankookia sp. GCM10030260]|uniref:hypothetical protein n=1 Tax=Dankookia sp. GCM10030260 TaxID=3273390 RepID=UPI00361DDC0D